jgi:hypothetical protein
LATTKVPVAAPQTGVATRLGVDCKFQPVEGAGHDTTAVLVVVRNIKSVGAPSVCTTEATQNPPVTE